MYVNMCLKFCPYWTVKSNVFYSQKFKNHGFKPSEKANNCLCLHSVLGMVPIPQEKKKIVSIKLFFNIWVYGFTR